MWAWLRSGGLKQNKKMLFRHRPFNVIKLRHFCVLWMDTYSVSLSLKGLSSHTLLVFSSQHTVAITNITNIAAASNHPPRHHSHPSKQLSFSRLTIYHTILMTTNSRARCVCVRYNCAAGPQKKR